MQNFISTITLAFDKETFVKLTLSKPRRKQSGLKKVVIQPVEVKGVRQLKFVYRHDTHDITKNHIISAGLDTIEELLNEQMMIGNLFTTEADVMFKLTKKGNAHIHTQTPTFTKPPDLQHDKEKKRYLGESPFLIDLGILDKNGRIPKDGRDKYRQIERYVEIIDSLLRQNPKLLKQPKLHITDMGSGKGYLTFAIYDYLTNQLNRNVKVMGVELREELVEFCNSLSRNVGFKNLSFQKGSIGDFDLPKTDILIALHACDTATDHAIAKGISAKAALIICAPCCHKQIRKSLKNSELFDPILNYGILKERQAEILTDTIRALLLEANGYKTKVFEFISTEHTGKNLMIVGQRHERKVDKEAILKKVAALKAEFGIAEHYLERLV